jgi:hypothetical protein
MTGSGDGGRTTDGAPGPPQPSVPATARPTIRRQKPGATWHATVVALLFAGRPVVLCRNVLIHFDAPTKQAVVDRLLRAREPGGLLFLGHSESLASLRGSSVRPNVCRAVSEG